MKKDNCKDCVSKCEHAGKDREFVCIGGVSCKVKKDEDKVSVIRCKDCEYWQKEYRYCELTGVDCYGSSPFGENSYCSRAKRREK